VLVSQAWALALAERLPLSPKNYYADPIVVAEHFIRLNRCSRVRTQPLNFRPESSKPAEMIWFICEIDRDNVRLIVASTSKPSETQTCQSIWQLQTSF
jgi:hypothetical protein